MLAGGGEDIHWSLSLLFDAMGALSTKYNDTPEHASRTYDADRDGFVISGGGGTLVLEAWSMRKPVAPPYWVNWLALVQLQTAPTWSPPAAKALSVACSRP